MSENKNTILLVGGKLTSGKDAFADHLVANHGFVKLGMSDILAHALYTLNPWVWDVDEDLKLRGSLYRYQDLVDRVGYVEAKKVDEVRRLLQVLGTEVGRKILGENVWVDGVRNKIQSLLDEGHHGIVITGIRFPNELSLEEDHHLDNGYNIVTSVWMERPGLPDAASHASESSVTREEFEYELLNDKTLKDLYTAADALLERIEGDYA